MKCRAAKVWMLTAELPQRPPAEVRRHAQRCPRWRRRRSGKERGSLPGHAAAVGLVAFAADGKTLLSGDVSGVVKRWDAAGKLLSSRKVTATGRAPSPLPAQGPAPKADAPMFVSLALAADGKTLALAGWELVGTRIVGLVWLWDVPSWRQRAQRWRSRPTGRPSPAAWAPWTIQDSERQAR